MNVCMCITKGGVLFYTLMFTVNFIRFFFFSLLHSVNDHLMSGTQVSSLKKKTIMLSNVLLKIGSKELCLILMNELVKLLGW